MKLLSRVGVLCALPLVLAACQSSPLQGLQSGLSSLDANLSSTTYVVRAGETLETIAFRYNTSAYALAQLNPKAAQGVYSGMHLVLRGPTNRPAVASAKAAVTAPAVAPAQLPTILGRTSPTQINQAVPVTSGDDFLLGAQRVQPTREVRNDRETGTAFVQRAKAPVTGYVEQPGYPVEEVIDDENFTLPTSTASLNSDLATGVDRWDWPMAGQLARDYDPQRPNGQGIEIVGLPGQQVHAARDGVVDLVARSPDGIGKVVIVRHPDNYLSVYSNARDLFVAVQDTVRQGDPIASLGANANDEPLLRFEISKDGKLLNPMKFLTPM